MRYVAGSVLLVVGAAVFPPLGQRAQSVGAWLVTTVAGMCFTIAYGWLAPPGAPALDRSAEKVEVAGWPAERDERGCRTGRSAWCLLNKWSSPWQPAIGHGFNR